MSERVIPHEALNVLPPAVEENAAGIAILENEAFYEIRSALPGVDAEDVIVGVADDVLTIGARACVETQHTLGRFFSIDHRVALVEQSFALPADADAHNLTTAFQDGVLSVFLSRTGVSNVVPLFGH
ncbi:MAG: Hsp20/alpha crystallin family protein [Rhodospirillaceae bacterium]